MNMFSFFLMALIPVEISYSNMYQNGSWSVNMFTFKNSHPRCSVKKVFLKISQISQENTCVGVSS